MQDRRLDPRTDAAFSLRNLLDVRADREEYRLAVLGTPDGHVIAGSNEGPLAEQTAAHGSLHLFARRAEAPYGRVSQRTPSGRLTGLRFECDGRDLFLALVDGSGREREHDDDRFLEEVAERVEAILREQRQRAAA